MQQPILSLRDVTVSYPRSDARGRVTVLEGIDLDVAEGEFVAMLGFSGSGKTTLVQAIAGLLSLDAGRVLVRGVPVTGPGPDRGVVFQSYSLMPWLTVEENIRLAVDAVHRSSSRRERDNLTRSTIELVGLEHAKSRKMAQLSGGMRQRVALARGLATRPEILLLDEPLSALDALTRAKLQDEIERIRAQERRTIVLVTNDVDEALLLADRVAVLERGPGARIARVFDVTLPRPRHRSESNHDPDFVGLRNDVVRYLDGLTHDEEPRKPVRGAWATPSSETTRASSSELDQTRGRVELRGITKDFASPEGPLTVVDSIDLTVAPGEFVSLIGHSGCGKSTVLSMIAGLLEPTHGTVALDDARVIGAGPERAMVFQSSSLLSWLTARQNVALGVDAVHQTMSRDERRALVEHYLARVGLGAAMDTTANQLSSGMRQRVGLARAFALHPSVLLLDEPFGMLDTLTRWSLQDVLLDIWADSGVTTVCVTHDVDEAILLADRVVMLTNGPQARLGQVLQVDLPRPRARATTLQHRRFYEHRETVLDFLASHDTGPRASVA